MVLVGKDQQFRIDALIPECFVKGEALSDGDPIILLTVYDQRGGLPSFDETMRGVASEIVIIIYRDSAELVAKPTRRIGRAPEGSHIVQARVSDQRLANAFAMALGGHGHWGEQHHAARVFGVGHGGEQHGGLHAGR